MNIRYQQRTVRVNANSSAEAVFSNIQGKLLGFATVPSDQSVDADLTIKDGANAILEPIDVRIGSIHKANNFVNGIVPLSRKSPGQIKAQVDLNANVSNYSVKVILYYHDQDDITLQDCVNG